MCATRCWACVTAHRNPACEAWMCRPAHVSGSVAGLSPCHGLPLHAGRACADQHQFRCRFSRHRAAPTTPRRGCQPLGLIRRTRCVKELRARRDRLALSQLLRETFPTPPPASAWFAPVSLGLGGLAALGSIMQTSLPKRKQYLQNSLHFCHNHPVPLPAGAKPRHRLPGQLTISSWQTILRHLRAR